MNCWGRPSRREANVSQPPSPPLQPPSGIVQPHALQMWKKLMRANQGTKALLLSPSLWFAIHSSPQPFSPQVACESS